MIREGHEKPHGVLQEEEVPCRQCKVGLHRICTKPVTIPTILSFLRGKKYALSETLTCCDRKELWTRPVTTD
jgi:hypothetical protein